MWKVEHHWVLFPVKIPPGPHELVAVSGRGAEMQQHFASHRTEARYAAVEYWNYADEQGRHITWRIQSEPMAFG